MRRAGQNVDCQRRRPAAEALRADAERVDAFQKLLLQCPVKRVFVRRIQLAQERLLCQQRRFVERAADPHAHHDGRARVRASVLHGLQNEALDALQPVGRAEHGDPAHVFAAEALGSDGDFDLFAGDKVKIEHGRGIIARVDAVKRVAHDGLA